MRSDAKTVSQYLKELPPERKKALSVVRRIMRANLPKGYEEKMNWGMITYQIPLKRYPQTYNGQPLMYAALGSQKNHMAVYMMSVYGDNKLKEWFEKEFAKTGKKLDMGKSCIRFKKIEDLPLDLIGKAISKVPVEQYIAYYENSRKK